MKFNNFILIITGPTACGKSALALELAKRFSGELVNADSVQVYKDFNIGSAKPTIEEMNLVPHHLFSIIHPNDEWNAGVFSKHAWQIVSEINERRNLPIIVGGTGLYIRSFIEGLDSLPHATDEVVNEVSKIISSLDENLTREEKSKKLYEILKSLSPSRAIKLHPHDYQRIVRAIVIEKSYLAELPEGKENEKIKSQALGYKKLIILLSPERGYLYLSINKRVDKMLDGGLIDEVKALSGRYDLKCKPFGAIGYKHVLEYLSGRFNLEETVELIKRDTRRFAKRQLTWWRNQPLVLGWEKKRWGESSIACNNLQSVRDEKGSNVITGNVDCLENLINSIICRDNSNFNNNERVSLLRFNMTNKFQ